MKGSEKETNPINWTCREKKEKKLCSSPQKEKWIFIGTMKMKIIIWVYREEKSSKVQRTRNPYEVIKIYEESS